MGSCTSQTAAVASTRKPLPGKGKMTRSHSRELQSALIIQSWFRRLRAHFELRHRVAWHIFQKLEYEDEAEQLRLQCFFDGILKNDTALRAALGRKSLDAVPLHPSFSTHKDFGAASALPTFTAESVSALIERLKRGQRPDSGWVLSLLAAVYCRLQTLPNLTRISTRNTGRLCVVGDLHGQLMDLLIILEKNGMPSDSNPYLFNGDFVDRGGQSVEVFIILFAFFLLCPGTVHINRGNHEDFLLSKRHGFEREVQSKYGGEAPALMRALSAVFTLLPLAALVDDSTLVVHAGISSRLTLDGIEAIDRRQYPSILTLAQQTSPGATGQLSPQEDLLVAMMWNDPGTVAGTVHNTRRNGGSIWGPQVTEDICRANNLKLIIRSHECQTEGYRYTHSGKVLTIFSASNYYAPGSNLGAYVRLSAGKSPAIVRYLNTPHFQATIRAKPLTLRSRACLAEEAAIEELVRTVSASRTRILSACKDEDRAGSGAIALATWERIMRAVVEGVPWRLVYYRFVSPAPQPGCVLYQTLLEASQTQKGPAALYPRLGKIEYIFRVLDADGSGALSREEVAKAISIFSSYEKENFDAAERVLAMMDFDKNGSIDFNEFAESFRLVYQQELSGSAPPVLTSPTAASGAGTTAHVGADKPRAPSPVTTRTTAPASSFQSAALPAKPPAPAALPAAVPKPPTPVADRVPSPVPSMAGSKVGSPVKPSAARDDTLSETTSTAAASDVETGYPSGPRYRPGVGPAS